MRIILLLFWGLIAPALKGQIFLGWNVAPLAGSTLDVQGFYHPKNEDWLSFQFGGGYTLNSPFFLTRKDDCVENMKHGGYHFRLGARHCLTTDHHSNYLFWGLNLIYSLQKESAGINVCDSSGRPATAERSFSVFSGAVSGGYSFNPWRRKSIYHPIQFDLGLQVAFPLVAQGEFLSSRNYISGLGYGNIPVKSLNLQLIAIVRFELKHFKYGYKNFRKEKR